MEFLSNTIKGFNQQLLSNQKSIILIPVFLIVILLILLLISNTGKKKRIVKDSIKFKSPIGILSKKIVAIKDDNKEIRKIKEQLQILNISVSIEGFFKFKIYLLIITLIATLLIMKTDLKMYRNYVIDNNDKSIQSNMILHQNTNTEKSTYQGDNIVKDIIEYIEVKYDSKYFEKEKDKIIFDIKSKIESYHLIIDELNVNQIAELIYSNLLLIYSKNINYLLLIFIGLLSYIAPDLLLYFFVYLRIQEYDTEITLIETISTTMGTMENVTIKDILQELANNTVVLKRYFNICLKEYSKDKKLALHNLKNNVSNSDFQKIIETFEQAISTNRILAFENLKKRCEGRKEYKKAVFEAKLESKTYIGILIISPVLLMLAIILLSPYNSYMDLLNFF